MGSQKPISRKTPSESITRENVSASKELSNKGYEVHTDASYPNGAFYAIEPEYNKKGEVIPRPEQEIDFVKSMAKQGFSSVLQAVRYDDKGNRMPSLEGFFINHSESALPFEGKSFELRTASDNNKLQNKVIKSLTHTLKEGKGNSSAKPQQAYTAVSHTPWSNMNEGNVLSALNKFAKSNSSARPTLLIQYDAVNKNAYLYVVHKRK